MIQKLKNLFLLFIRSTLNSYSQVFFSNNRKFALILILVSFFDLYAGISGLLAVVVSNTLAYLIGFNRSNIKHGYYGFNSLLVGLGLGIYFCPGIEFYTLLFFASLLTLFLTLMLEGVIGKYGLPFLSISFLIGIWVVTLASREFTALSVSERGIYTLNDMYSWGGITLVNFYNWFNSLNIHKSILIYFNSLGAILFQYNILAGVLIATGILIYSRIAFLLSLIGFFSAYFYYQFIGANIAELSYSYIGFNFILTSIAIGGYFIIPSKHSFLWIILLVPLISIFIISTDSIFSIFQLSVYSLPFNIIVLLFLYGLKFRERFFNKPEIVVFQQNSPESNLYLHINNKRRSVNSIYLPFSLPFLEKWTVSQGHNGHITHKNEWRHAWDFVITDDAGHTFKNNGTEREDFFCYNKPVIAPANGTVEEITDDIEDNKIGDVNLEQNWGNTIVIKHTNLLYSKISHIKKGTYKVSKGDIVKKGDILAFCGNSGRSPEPHIHFQMQSTPYIDSKTLDYPLSYYMTFKKQQKFELKISDRPEKDETISNITKNTSLYNAFHFIPGQKISFIMTLPNSKQETKVNWEVRTDIYNNSFIYSKNSKSKAYFINDGSMHYFTNFEGNKESLLFYFYLAAYKVVMGFYKGLTLKDNYSLHLLNKDILIFLQDFIAPFFIFMHSDYTIEYAHIKEYLNDSSIILKSKTEVKLGKKLMKKIDFKICLNNDKIEQFVIISKNKKIEAKQI